MHRVKMIRNFNHCIFRLLLFLLLALLSHSSRAAPLGTAFTYQGHLTDNGGPAQGIYDLQFTIYDVPSAGSPVSGTVTSAATSVSNGLFTITLDLGAGIFTGEARWLEIGVRTNGAENPYVILSPRQPLTPAPYSLFAPLAGTVPDGAITSSKLASNAVTAANIEAGSITATQLATGAAAANLQAGAQSPVASSGIILSDDPTSSSLTNAGYVRVGRVILDQDGWQERNIGPTPGGRSGHTAIWTGSEMIIWGGVAGSYLNSGARYNPSTDTWTPTSTSNAPSPRANHTAVWTGTEMIIWGGFNASSNFECAPFMFCQVGTGARYNPSTDTWTPLANTNGPTPRYRHTAVWTGTEMIIWGGVDLNGQFAVSTGHRYNPSSDSWSPVSTASGLAGRYNHTAVWTGTEMIIWGGAQVVNPPGGGSVNPYNDGARYDPSNDMWTGVQTFGAHTARDSHTAVWSGDQMIVWGGRDSQNRPEGSGKSYSPSANGWASLSTSGAPLARFNHTAIWTGSGMIIWAGVSSNGFENTGARYSLSNDTWTAATSTTNAPAARHRHTAVWTGGLMIVWGGEGAGGALLNSGGRYLPSNDSWLATSTAGAPSPRQEHTAVWTGNEMIVWGGGTQFGQAVFNTGARYNPATDSWLELPPGNAPSARRLHTAVWTGTEMIIWGGNTGTVTSALSTGGRYNPAFNTWTSTSISNAPSPRYYHSAVWTGTEMIIWGGFMGTRDSDVNTGGRYNPLMDSWTPTTVTNAPQARDRHTAVWTGTEMIVWGGSFEGFIAPGMLNTGGRYNPNSDTWTPTASGMIAGTPSARRNHTAIWTGNEMIIFGGSVPGFGPNPTTFLNTGGRYNLATDTWLATPTNGAPSIRDSHAAIWTANEMIVWGGTTTNNTRLATGGRYDPVANTWLETETMGAPLGRSQHSAVWTGSGMLVFGGFNPAFGVQNSLHNYFLKKTSFLYQRP